MKRKDQKAEVPVNSPVNSPGAPMVPFYYLCAVAVLVLAKKKERCKEREAPASVQLF